MGSSNSFGKFFREVLPLISKSVNITITKSPNALITNRPPRNKLIKKTKNEKYLI